MVESLTQLFIQTAKKHRSAMRAILGEKGLHPGQPAMLHALSQRDGQSQKELSERLHHKAATTTVMLKRMEKAGLVRRMPDPDDQRITRVYITEKGHMMYQEMQEAVIMMENISFASFSEEEKKQLQQLLMKMCGNLEQAELPSSMNEKE